MVVLNIYSKIESICISKKLRLYIGNINGEHISDWKTEIIDKIVESNKKIKKNEKKFNLKNKYNFEEYYKKILQEDYLKFSSEESILEEIADRMIYIYFDYDYEDMPLGDWKTNCFDGRLCEEDYAEKIIDFINFNFDSLNYEKKESVNYIYSSNNDTIQNDYQIFWYNTNTTDAINTLKEWGKLFDNLLNDRNDYLKFDYFVNSIHDHTTYNEYYYFKLFSLCQLFLENKREVELDWKLVYFLNDRFTNDEKNKITSSLRKMRNKIAHGDFVGFEKEINNYSKVAMKNFWYDCSEYSKRNWIINNAICLLEKVLQNIFSMMFYKNDILLKLKNADSKDKFTI